MKEKHPICHCRKIFSDSVRFIVATCLFFAIHARAQVIDLNHNGMSDVWEWEYNVYGISPNIDSDGDGFTNWQEAVADTDPLNPNSYPRMYFISSTPTNFSLAFPSAPGKLYTIESI